MNRNVTKLCYILYIHIKHYVFHKIKYTVHDNLDFFIVILLLQSLAVASLNLGEILQYPANKLHRTLPLRGVKGSARDLELGSLDLWFKLHATDLKPIQRYVAGRQQEESMLTAAPMAALNMELAAEGGLHILQDRREGGLGQPKGRQPAASSSRPVKGGRGLLERKRAVQKSNNREKKDEESDSVKVEEEGKQQESGLKEDKEGGKSKVREAVKVEAKEVVKSAEAKKPARKVSKERPKTTGNKTTANEEKPTEDDRFKSRPEHQKEEPHKEEKNTEVANVEAENQSFMAVASPAGQLANITKNRVKPPRVSKKSATAATGDEDRPAVAAAAEPNGSGERPVLAEVSEEKGAAVTAKKEIKSILVKTRPGPSQAKPVRRRVSLEEETTTTVTANAVQMTTTASTSRSMEIEETDEDDEEEESEDDSSYDEDDDSEEEESEEDETTMQSSTTTTATTTETTTHIDTEDTSSAAVGATTSSRRVVLANVERGEAPADSDGDVVAEQASNKRKGILTDFEHFCLEVIKITFKMCPAVAKTSTLLCFYLSKKPPIFYKNSKRIPYKTNLFRV